METITWELARERIESVKDKCEEHLQIVAKQIQMYRTANDDGERLAQLLADLNYHVMILGDYQAGMKRLELWTTHRYAMEKAFSKLRLLRSEKKVSAAYAEEAKYEGLESFLDIMVDASAMHMRLQNGRSSARDTTEAIRSRISQIKGALRS